MKLLNRSSLIALVAACLLMACTDNSIPQEGKQYVLLPTLLEDETLLPVTEVFSLTCSHCRKMEAVLPQISSEAGADIGKLHITFNRSAQVAAMFYYAAEMQLGKDPDHTFMDQLFAAIQMGGDTTQADKQAAIEKVFASSNLISPYQFNQQQNEMMLAKVKIAERLSTQSAINSVPSFIVNGRYQVIVSEHKDQSQIANTIRYLLNK
ncbi:thiol:disulfide interchange protein DsbA/DsbL [Psychromonas sp.]|uniref:thiol:disulfide interchange protein DsbA/DsbL n=1 Tax=Psychromonas sp. TaxID=1884585 RepID=UPI0035635A96